METKELREEWGKCQDRYLQTGFMVRQQLAPIMEPLLALTWGLIQAVDGLKAKNCSAGAKATCTGRGCPGAAPGGQGPFTRAAEPAQPLRLGGPLSSSAHPFPTIEG